MLPALALAFTKDTFEGNFFYTDMMYDHANEGGLHVEVEVDGERYPLFITTQEPALAIFTK